MKKVKCSKCEHYFYNVHNGNEYCIEQAMKKRLFTAYFKGEIDDLPKLIPPHWRCRDFKKRNEFNPYIL
ncbi:MAG: hypothetical protein FWD71_02185 [Oscillospiraceae bacterium]|nr:hypothetical protein [Oscillospiraceae bacterium]